MNTFMTGKVTEFLNKIHDVAKDNPMMTEDQMKSLMESIKSIGQSDPIKIYRKMVIDGRNRLQALHKLGIMDVKYIQMPHKTTLDELQAIANGSEARRHQTKTQLAIKAFKMSQKIGISMEKAADTVGVSLSLVKHAAAISKKRPDILDILHGGNLFKLPNGYGTDSLATIHNTIKNNHETNSISPSTVEQMMDNAKPQSDESKQEEVLKEKVENFINIAGLNDADIILLEKIILSIAFEARMRTDDLGLNPEQLQAIDDDLKGD